MIKQLQKRFILAAMLSLTLVLTIIIGSGSIMNYYEIVSRADETLTTLTENNGSFIKDSVEEYLAAKKAYLYGEGEAYSNEDTSDFNCNGHYNHNYNTIPFYGDN